MLVKRFKNGNFNVKMEESDFNRESTLVNLIWALQEKDCNIFGEEYCMDNTEMAIDMYCYYTDMIVRIPYRVLNDLESGKTVKLYAHKPNEYEVKEIERLTELDEL